jgi:protein gp37
MANTTIEWADKVWNPIRGCSRISPGCMNCYAETFAARFSKPGQVWDGLVQWTDRGARWTGEVNLIYDKLEDPVHWRKPSRIFVNSMSDLFHEQVPDSFIKEVFGVMSLCEQHTFQILTKRALRMEQWFGSTAAYEAEEYAYDNGVSWPLENVWLGVSVENQDYASERVPSLLECPSLVKFVSAEPLIEELDLTMVEHPIDGGYFNALDCGVNWVIVGCESGKRSNRRSMAESWVRDLRWQCRQHTTAVFYKQAIDERGQLVATPLLEGKRWSQYPDER